MRKLRKNSTVSHCYREVGHAFGSLNALLTIRVSELTTVHLEAETFDSFDKVCIYDEQNTYIASY